MSQLFNLLKQREFEQIVYGYDKYSGLKSIIAIHNTALGPAFGGTRMMPYATEDEALEDSMRLARGMTYKNAAAGLDFGGGKAVIIGDPKTDKTEDLLRAFGRLVNGLAGRYITAIDVATDENDMVFVHRETDYCVALPESYGGSGNVSAATAYGLYHGMKAAVEEIFGEPTLRGRSVAIQGVGHVGSVLTKYLVDDGASVSVADVDEESLKKIIQELKVNVVAPEKIYDLDVDIFSPCALGGILNDDTIPRLKCKLIAGSANNQLLDEERHCKMVEERGIAYAVDYIINAGGVINCSTELMGYNRDRAYVQMARIAENVKKVFKLAKEKQITTVAAANLIAEHRIQMAINRKAWEMPKGRHRAWLPAAREHFSI